MKPLASIGKDRDGFTLLELLISVAVLAVLAGLLFPAIQGARQRASSVQCMNSMRQMYVALFAYRTDVGYFPPGRLNVPGDSLSLKMADHLVPKYIGKLPYCPLMRLTPAGVKELRGKTEKEHFEETGSYSMNAFLTYTRLEGLPGPLYGGFPYPGDSKMLFIADIYYSGLTWAADQMGFTLNGADWPTVRVAPRDHGNKKLHFMFLDGHATAIAPKVRSNGTYDWSESFDSWGRNGTYIWARGFPNP
jgi:prepilin-type N-terminal cleavage/methylation domain-containing protein/prepilin-type processing-associated H-X9-DG protein